MLIGVLAVKCKEQTCLDIHRMTCRFWKELCGRKVQLQQANAFKERRSTWKIKQEVLGL